MDRYRTRQIISIAVGLIIVAVAIAALVSVARFLFFPEANSAQITVGEQALVSTDADREVKMTVRGPIVADENFLAYDVDITPNARKLTLFKGYLDQSIGNISLGNNIPAYEQFVYALDKANLAQGIELTGSDNDTRGVCATGDLYIFDILQSGKSVKQLWTTSCSNARGSLSASLSQLTRLFTAQIPNAESLTSKLGQ